MFRFVLAAVTLTVAALLMAGLAESASAAAKVVGKDGQLSACYRVKGKPKGQMRLVAKNARCKRGERKVRWAMAGPTGAAGQPGAPGQTGAGGTGGAAGENGDTPLLEAKIASLTLKVEGLEDLLGDVTGQLEDVTGSLQDVLGLVPVVGSICEQVSGLTSGLDEVNEGIKDLTVLGLVGLALGNLGVLPQDLLETYACPPTP